MTKLGIDPKTAVYLTAAFVLPQLVADTDGEEPDEIADLVATAVEFGLELASQVESHFAPEIEETESKAS